mmetsp:Transcript_1558/g.4719  ORF Transcript_1558/g.4719 Transcript_1558/m.4719 type:complete len:104 (-) Transcript_1558:468-779(-)
MPCSRTEGREECIFHCIRGRNRSGCCCVRCCIGLTIGQRTLLRASCSAVVQAQIDWSDALGGRLASVLSDFTVLLEIRPVDALSQSGLWMLESKIFRTSASSH